MKQNTPEKSFKPVDVIYSGGPEITVTVPEDHTVLYKELYTTDKYHGPLLYAARINGNTVTFKELNGHPVDDRWVTTEYDLILIRQL
jgi:hypothetical protein